MRSTRGCTWKALAANRLKKRLHPNQVKRLPAASGVLLLGRPLPRLNFRVKLFL